MIQPNELRTGNLIKSVRDEELFVVTGIKNRVAKEIEAERIRDKQYIGWCFLSIFEPIALTPEWLKRVDWNGYNYLYFNSNFCLDEQTHLYYRSDYTGINVYYVHQLQNLYFALTGKELAIDNKSL